MSVRIGLIDDHPVVIGGLRASLGSVPGFAVVATAGTVSDAAGLLDRTDVDVALLDVRLADGNGLDLLRRHRGPGAPAVIVLSSFRTSQYVVAAVRFGAQGFLVKTAPLATVVEAVRQVAAGGSWFTAEQLRAGADGFVALTPRERDVLRLVLAGRSNDEIGAQTRLTTKSIEGVLSRLYERFGVANRLELGLRAEREAWLEVEPG